MAYVTVPKDLMAVRTKVMFNLTKRQLSCFTVGALTGFAVYMAINSHVESSEAMTVMILTMFPFFLLAMYEKHGQPLEVVVKQVYAVKFNTAKHRPYKSQNFYSLLETQHDMNKEVYGIVHKKTTGKNPRQKQNTGKKTSKSRNTAKKYK